MADKKFKPTVGVFWKKTYQVGGVDKPYWTGSLDLGVLGKIDVVAFPNGKKEPGSSQPDIIMQLSEKRDSSPAAAPATADQPLTIDNADIPF